MIAPVLIVVAFTAAQDPESKELAAKSFAEGESAFAKRQYNTAALAFERAARLVPHPSTWLNAAEAWERANNPVAAAEDCDRVLEIIDAPEKFVAEAKKRLERLEPRIAKIEVTGSPDNVVRIDNSEPRRAPFVKRVAAGDHKISWSKDQEKPQTQVLSLRPGETQAIALDPEPSSEPTPESVAEPAPVEEPARVEEPVAEAEPPVEETREPSLEAPPPDPVVSAPEEFGPPPSSWLAFGAATVALGVGSTFGALTLSAKSAYNDDPSNERADAFFDRRRTANIAWVVTAVAAAAGVGLWILDDLAL